MRFLADGPDLPEDLIRAQLSGHALFVVGAGVSKRVGLPLFDGLTTSIYGAIGQATPDLPETLADIAEKEAWTRKEWDRILGLLEKRIVYPNPNLPEAINPIRASVGAILGARTRDLTPFKHILAISTDSNGRSRVVTTNFDTLFERAWRRVKPDKPRTFAGPGLPAVGSPEFHGVMHLHGRIHDKYLGLAATDLVLTSADFGEAYLRSGWASRFVYDLLRRYTLVFLGYAADDPPMRYMLEATEAGRLKFPDLQRAYAFAEVGEVDNSDGDVRARWRAKGLEPIVYRNGDGSYDLLYESIASWAEFSRNARSWADREIKAISSKAFAEVTDEERNIVRFLVDTVSDTETLLKHALSPDWLECRIKKGSPPELPFRDAYLWQRNWISRIDAAKWSMSAAAQPVAPAIGAASVLSLGSVKPELSSFLSMFWQLYHIAHPIPAAVTVRPDWQELRRKLKTGVTDHFAISAIVEIVHPNLNLRGPWRDMYRTGTEPLPEPSTLSDLCRIEYECAQWPTIAEILLAYPTEARAEARLLSALTSTLTAVCGLAQDAQSISDDGDSVSRDVALVHVPSVEDVAPAIADWGDEVGQPNYPDDHNHSFVPIVRLASSLWKRLAEKDGASAAAIARAWIGHQALLVRRLGYWAASELDQGLITEADAYLRTLDRKTFWRRELTAEAARFWCKRWNKLNSNTRSRLERIMCEGPELKWFWSSTSDEDRRQIAERMALRELRRVQSARGRLFDSSKQRIRELARRQPSISKRVPLYSGLYSVSWSSSGPISNSKTIATVPVEKLVERVDEEISADPRGQRDLWSTMCRERPNDAFEALLREGTQGNWPRDKWSSIIVAFLTPNQKTRVKVRNGKVVRAMLKMPDAVLTDLVPSVVQWLSWTAKDISAKDARRSALQLWDRLTTIVELTPDDLATARTGRNLASESLSEPAGELAEVLTAIQGVSPRRAKGGLAHDLAPRFGRLVALPGRKRIFVLARLVQSLAFFNWLDPVWAETHILSALDSDSDEARELLETLVLYGRYDRVRVLSRLKTRIFGAVLSDRVSDEARQRLASLVTWMTIRRLSGRKDVEVTETEARQLLTRAPADALRSIAWSLWRSLLDVKQQRDRKAHWRRYIRPFLEKVWPNDVSTRDATISENLTRIPGATAEAFPDAVKLVSTLVVPFRAFSAKMGLGLDENDRLIGRYPTAVLKLAIACLDLTAPPPYDLQKFLDDLSRCAPSVKADVRFQKLNSMLHGP
jgi:hypothetical protein